MKYLFLNDMEYLFHHRKKFLILIICVPILFLSIYIQSKTTGLEMVHLSMGTKLNISGYSLTELISFIFNITIFLFIMIDIYVKDMEYQLDCIFLRMKPVIWYLKKSLYFIIIIIMTKAIQYLFLILLIGDKLSLSDVLFLLRNDCVYILFLQYLFLLIYLGTILILKSKLSSIFIFLLAFMVLPKNIYELKYVEIYWLGIILINIINCWILKKWNKKIMEKI